MTGLAADTTHVVADAPPPGTTPPRTALVAVGVAFVVALATLALALVTGIRFDHWAAYALAATAVSGLACALPLHLAALKALGSGRAAPELVGTVAMLALLGHAAYHLDSGLGGGTARDSLAAAAVVAVLLTLASVGRVDSGRELGWYAAAAVVVALLALAGWSVLDTPDAGWSAGLAVLAAACPAALLIATASVLRRVNARGGAHGATYADGRVLEEAGRIDTVVLDKDQTVTTGAVRISAMEPLDPADERNLPWFAGALSHAWEHPIGRALSRGVARGRLREVQVLADLGITGRVDKHPVGIGRFSWVEAPQSDTGTTLGVEVDARPLGVFTVVDTVRESARSDVDRLRELGVEVLLVSEGTEAQAAWLADQVGSDRSFAGLDAAGRERLVESLHAQGRVVAWVGPPGSNEAALRAADLGVSTTGTSIVMESLDTGEVTPTLALARGALPRARLNRRLALGVAGVGVLLAAAGVLGPLAASGVAALGVVVVLGAALVV